MVLVLVYVDDILITGDCFALIHYAIQTLTSRFALKTLGSISYFLGFEAFRDSSGLYLNQAKYISDLLVKTNMVHAKSSSTPMALSQKLALEDSAHFPDATLYCSTIGALQYLTLTWPDIYFSVNKLSQFLEAPTQHRWSACKRLFAMLVVPELLVYLSDLLLDLHLKASRMLIGRVMLMTEDLRPVIVFFLVEI